MLLDTMKKLAVIITIAILFSVFTFSTVEIVNEAPEYNDYCKNDRYPIKATTEEQCPDVEIPQDEQSACSDLGGYMRPVYSSDSCVASYECDTCSKEFDDAMSHHRMLGFIMTSVLGLIAVLVGIYAQSDNEVVQWVYSGFIIGGIISIFIGTVTYYNDMNRFLRPVIMLAEMGLVIFVAMKNAKRIKKKK